MNTPTMRQPQNRPVTLAKFLVACLLMLSFAIPYPLFAPLLHPVKAQTSSTGAGPTLRQQDGKVYGPPRKERPDTPHLLAASYYNAVGNLSATLMLSNQGPRPLTVQPTLFNLTGDRFDVPAITLEGNTVRSIDLREYISAGAQFQEGSLQVAYQGKPLEIGGVVQMVDQERSLIFDEELTEPATMFSSSRLEGVWWLPSRRCEVSLALSNITDSVLSVTTSVSGTVRGATEPEVLTLLPHETRVLNMRDFIEGKGGASAEKGRALPETGGISIEHSGQTGALLAHGMVQDARRGYSSVIEFSDPGHAKSSKLNGTGLRLGRVAGERLTSVVVARNVGDAPTVFTGRIPFTTSDGRMDAVSLPEVRLAPGEAKEVNLTQAVKGIRLVEDVTSAGLEFEYAGAPGSVVMAAQSVSKSGTHVFRVPLVDAAAQMSSTGTYPWSVDDESSTFVYVKNVTDRPQRYVLEVRFAGGGYSLGLKTIEAGQTMTLDVRALRDSQVPDERGQTIPLDVDQGQVHWSAREVEPLVLMGRAEQMNTAKGLSMTSACATYCINIFYAAWLTPGSVDLLVDDTHAFFAWQQDQDSYSTPGTPYMVSAQSWLADEDVTTHTSAGNVTALNAGDGFINGYWDAIIEDSGWYCYATLIAVSAVALIQVGPRITSISPSRGLVGNNIDVTINGSGFRSNSTVQVGGSGVSVSSYTVNSSTRITARFAVAANASGGNRSVTVRSGGRNSNSRNFFVQVPTSARVLGRGVFTGSGLLPNGCFAGQPYGFRVSVRYQVLDQDENDIDAVVPLRENLINFITDGQSSAPNQIGVSIVTGDLSQADGTFTDQPVGGCATGPFNISTFTQEVFSPVSSTVRPIFRTNSWRFSGRASCGNMTNGSDEVNVSVPCQ